MTIAAAAKKAKPRVDDPERWEVELTGEPISDDAIAGIARLLIDRAKRRLEVHTEESAGSRQSRMPDDSLIGHGQEGQRS